MLWRQCKFKSGKFHRMAWVQESFKGHKIKAGSQVKFEDSGDERWWTVQTVGEYAISEEKAKKISRYAKKFKDVGSLKNQKG